MSKLHEEKLPALLLVRAVEQHAPEVFSAETLSESALAAVAAGDDLELLEQRSAYLFSQLPRATRAWARTGLFPDRLLAPVAAVAFLLGALSNYLGPDRLVHVAYNPLVFLVAWNLVWYPLRIWRRARDREPRGARLRLQLRELFVGWQRVTARFRRLRGGLRRSPEIAAAYFESYWGAAGGAVVARVDALMHSAAIALLLGALAGIYVRGLFFEYSAAWNSTFLGAESIASVLGLVLGPACWILDGAPLSRDAVQPLLSPGGAPAAPWIHRLALTSAIAVALPRAILALLARRRARRAAEAVEIDLSEPYYRDALRSAREGQIHRIREGVANAIRAEIASFAESLALLVRDRFFDRRVAPVLQRFRARGGRISELEAELALEREGFEAELEEPLRRCEREFQQRVRASVAGIVGAELTRKLPRLSAIDSGSLPIDPGVAAGVATGMGDAVAATLTAAATASAATLSGGIGKTLGIAIVSGLLHTSGPIGLLIGGVAALATVGGAFVLGRERVSSAAKGWRLPAALLALALRDAKLEAARAATTAQVERDVEARLERQIAETTELLLQQLSRAALGIGGVAERESGPA